MKTLTFTQKLSRQRRFLSSLLPLFAIFIGLGSINPVWAQPAGTSTASIRNVIVSAGTSSSSVSTGTYDAIPTTGGSGVVANGGTGIFANTNFGTLDVSAGRLLLQGGTVEIMETNGETFNRAFIEFVVTPGTISGVAGGATTTASQAFNRQIELVQTGFSGGVRTFMVSNAARNLLAMVTTAGAGQSYRFDIAVNATGLDANGDDITVAGGNGNRRRSVFTATGTPATSSLSPNNIQVGIDGNAAMPYYFPNTGTQPQFPGYTFTSSDNANGVSGAFDLNSGQLRINNTLVTTNETGASTITSVILYYRTRLVTDGGGAFQPITLTQSGPISGGTRTFVIDPSSVNNTNSQPNLIATPAVTAAGDYAVDIYYQANGSTAGTPFSITYPPSGFSTAFFKVDGVPIANTIWTGAVNDNWFDPANWSNGVPTPIKNALVRDLGAGNSVPYPNINSGIRVTTAAGALLYDNSTSGPAQARNLILGGTSQASRSITRLVAGQLQVFGDFSNTFDSFIQRENTIMEFAGINQAISGGSFYRVDISGGGNKTLSGVMNISSSLNFLTGSATGDQPAAVNPYTANATNAGVLVTDVTQDVTKVVVVLADRSANNANNGAQVTGETESSWLFGFVRTSRQGVLVGETRTYGNLGMTITFTGANNPGNVEVTRNTQESYTPLNSKFGIRRIFGVRPSDQATNTGGLLANLSFRYRDTETRNLGGPNTITPGMGSIPENQLVLFVSSNSGNTFGFLGRDGAVDVANNIVNKSGVRTFATFTLGDQFNPLPVRLTAFDAKRMGADAMVTWQTATEENSKGYEVQVSTNGTEFRTLTFVPSASPNSVKVTSYSFLDNEANKSGLRYYRLRQIDLDGKDAFFAPVAVNFNGKNSEATALVAYPNPFNGNDELHIALKSTGAGKGQLTIADMTGRTVRQESVDMTVGVTDVTVNGLNDLKAGMYMVRMSLPSGEVKNLKIVKQ